MEIFEYEKFNETVCYEKLDCGLDVYLVKKADYYKKLCQITTKYGSVDEIKGSSGYTGIAHYFEHMLFNTKDGDISEKFLEKGASVNAFTSYFQTSYYFSTINNFSVLVKELLDFVYHPSFTNKLVEKERGIILEELKMNLDSPQSQIYYETMNNLFFYNHIQYEIVGRIEDVNSIKKEDLEQVFDYAYNPSNMILFMIGDINIEEELQNVKNIMNSFNIVKKEVNKVIEPEPVEVQVLNSTIKLERKQTIASLGFKFSDFGDSNRFMTKLLMVLSYSISETSEIYEKMLNDGIINTSFYYNLFASNNTSFVYISSETYDKDAFFSTMLKALENFEMTKDTLDKFKLKFYGSSLAELNGLEDYAYSFIQSKLENSNMFDIDKILDSISLDEINNMKNMFKHYTKVYSV